VSIEASFIGQIAKIKRRAAVTAVHSVLLNAGLIFLGLQLGLFIAAIAGLTDTKGHGLWYLVSSGISLSAAILIGLATRRNFLTILVEIDRRSDLQDRLSTAYEYHKLKKESEFKDLLMQDAAVQLDRLNGGLLLPVGFSQRHLILIFMLIAGVALYAVDYPALRFKSTLAGQETIEHAGALLRNYTFRRIENHAGPQTGRHTDFADKLEQLSKQLDDSSRTFDQQVKALAGTLKEVQAERVSVRQIPAPENLPPDQPVNLKELLKKTLKGEIPAALNENVESLQEMDSIAKLLSRIMDDVTQDRSETAESAAPSGDENQTSQGTGRPDNVRDDTLGPITDGRLPAAERNNPDRTGQPGAGQLQANEGGHEDDAGLREGDSSSAGSAESNGEKKSSAEIEKSTGPAVADNMTPSPVKSYLIHIRALTEKGEARRKEVDFMRTYSKEVESILQKEDIPLNYREYIKNYFMALGLNTEK
jgi:hypothetical protein